MQYGAITNHIDVAQLALYAFWLFFAGLILYLRREDKREGYPLTGDNRARVTVEGFPPTPSPKAFLLEHGETVYAPRKEAPEARAKAEPTGFWEGAPLDPTGDAMQDAVGPAAYAQRADVPDLAFDDQKAKIVPFRVAPQFWIDEAETDPRGMTILGADGIEAGVVRDAWIDRSEMILRYLEVTVRGAVPRYVLIPMNLLDINPQRRTIRVGTALASQIEAAPLLKNPDQVTLREEDRISAYFGGGQLYSTPEALEPLL